MERHGTRYDRRHDRRHDLRRRRGWVRVVLAGGLVALAACTGAPAPGPTPTASATGTGPVDVVGLWSGAELDDFRAVAATWEAGTGGTVDWTGSRDLERDLAARLAAHDPPDLAVLPNPGLLRGLVADGALVPLTAAVGPASDPGPDAAPGPALDPARVARDYAPPWTALGSVDGTLYGLVVKATDKTTVWYAPPAFAADGDAVPATWDDLLALADRAVADGRTPFSVVAPRGPGSGWALTDWVSVLVLRACGPDAYDAWVAAAIPWTDPCVRDAFGRLAVVLGTPGYVHGGSRAVLTTGDAEGVLPVYADPPGASVYPMASFAEGFIAAAYPGLVPGQGYDWFPFPAVDPAHADAVTVGGDLVVLLRDTPAARSFLAFLTGADAQAAWAARGGYTSVNRSVPPAAYADPVARSVAAHLTGAAVVRFGAGDLVPVPVQRAWSAAMLRLVEDPGALDAVLRELTEVAAAAR